MGPDLIILLIIIVILVAFLIWRLKKSGTVPGSSDFLEKMRKDLEYHPPSDSKDISNSNSKSQLNSNVTEKKDLVTNKSGNLDVPPPISGSKGNINQQNTNQNQSSNLGPLLPAPGDPNFPELAKVPADQRGYGPDCYLFPNSCPPDHFCMIADRSRWSKKENGSKGTCRPFQKECYSCTASYEDYLMNKEKYPALGAMAFDDKGQYISRQTICAPHLACTGNDIPTLPPTCVLRRPKDREYPPTREEFIKWCLAFVRLGGRPSKGLKDRPCKAHNHGGICVRYPDNVSPLTKGASREEILKTANNILKTLWPQKLGPYPGPLIPGVHDSELPSCDDTEYLNQLKDYQKQNGGPEYRAPVGETSRENPPRCLYKDVDYAYNDESVSIWSMIHTITANLPDILTPEQVEALRTIPMYLRKFISCADCRGNIKEHLIDIGIPNSHYRFDWFKHYHVAHNFVSEQTSKTRFGENTGAGYPWSKESNICAGKYAEAWYMPLQDAIEQWTIK